MKETKARQILQALIQGVDPTTGEELPPGTVVQNADVLRALLAGKAALEAVAARAARRAQLPGNVGRNWDKDEESALVAEFQAGMSVTDIATKHGRTVRAIEARLVRLKLLKPDQRVTQSNFLGDLAGGSSDSDPKEGV